MSGAITCNQCPSQAFYDVKWRFEDKDWIPLCTAHAMWHISQRGVFLLRPISMRHVRAIPDTLAHSRVTVRVEGRNDAHTISLCSCGLEWGHTDNADRDFS